MFTMIMVSVQFARLVVNQSLAYLYMVSQKYRSCTVMKIYKSYGSSTNWRTNLKTYPYNRSASSRVFLSSILQMVLQSKEKERENARKIEDGYLAQRLVNTIAGKEENKSKVME